MSDHTSWKVDEAPSPPYLRWAETTGSLYASSQWSPVVAALGATSLFGWHAARGIGVQVACFRRGPFRIGVAGLPVAGERWDALKEDEFATLAQALCIAGGLDLMRVNRSMQVRCPDHATVARPEAWIDDLPSWSGSGRLRKDLAFARRSSAGISIVPSLKDPASCYALYAGTVRKHGGKLRYSEAYFHALDHSAFAGSRLACFSAVDSASDVIAFGVTGIDGSVAHYLHGAADDRARRAGTTDLLLEAMVAHARSVGCRRMSLMATPWDQPGLARFKAKWSDAQGLSVTYDLAGSAPGRLGRTLLRWQSRHDRWAAKEKSYSADGV